MITNREAIDLAMWAYTVPPDIVGPLVEHPIRIHFAERDGVTYVIPEGSKTKADWIDDFRFWADPFLPKVAHDDGFIPEGFYLSAESVVDELANKLNNGTAFGFVAHSRGGGQAPVLAKLLIDRGLVARQLYLIEPARAFIFKIPTALAAIPTWGTWNGNDPVPHVPLGQQFPLQIIGRPELDPFDCHHLVSVAAALDAAS